MRFDEMSNMFVLTNEDFTMRGYDLEARLAATQATNATAQINGFFYTVSEIVYEYIHDHNIANSLQDRILKKLESAQKILFRALMAQAVYMYQNGDLSLSVDEADKAVSPRAKRELEVTIPEIGRSIVYTGYLPWI